MDVYIDAFVDELPEPSENDRFVILNKNDNDYDTERISFDDYTVSFAPASKESIEDFEKLRIEVPEKSVTCSDCLDDVPVGSGATRLPCSYLKHEIALSNG